MEEYVAKKSVWCCLNFWWIISCLLIIPIIFVVFRILSAKAEKITFYSDKVVWEKGFLSKKVRKFAFTGVFSVDIDKPFIGRIFNYGHLDIDFVGKCDINTFYIKDPDKPSILGSKVYLGLLIVFLILSSKFSISSSLSTINFTATDWTLPADNPLLTFFHNTGLIL